MVLSIIKLKLFSINRVHVSFQVHRQKLLPREPSAGSPTIDAVLLLVLGHHLRHGRLAPGNTPLLGVLRHQPSYRPGSLHRWADFRIML